MKNRILVLSPGYYPAGNYGGPAVSINNFANLLGDNYEIYIITRDHELGEKERLSGINDGWNKHNKANVLYLKEQELNSKTLIKIEKEIKANIIYANSILDYKLLLPAIKTVKKLNIKLLIAPRGELCENAFNIKKYKKIPYIHALRTQLNNQNIFIQSTSDEETKSINKRLKTNNIIELTNIPTVNSQSNDKQKNKTSGILSAIYVGRIHPKKNLLFTIECLKSVKGKVHFDIYGPKEDTVYWKKIEDSIKEMPTNIVIRYVKNLKHDEVIKTMANYHCFIFHTLSENYGHTIAEAIEANCIPIISNTTPWNGISKHKAGYVSSLNNKQQCIDSIQEMIDCDNSKYKTIIKNLNKYKAIVNNIAIIKKQYITAIEMIVNENKTKVQ